MITIRTYLDVNLLSFTSDQTSHFSLSDMASLTNPLWSLSVVLNVSLTIKLSRKNLSHLTLFVNTTHNVEEKISLTIQKTEMTLQGDSLCIYIPQLNITRAL